MLAKGRSRVRRAVSQNPFFAQGPDAVVLVRPASPHRLRPFLDHFLSAASRLPLHHTQNRAIPWPFRRLKPGPFGSLSRLFRQFHVRDLNLPSVKPALDAMVQTHRLTNGGEGFGGPYRMLSPVGFHASLMME